MALQIDLADIPPCEEEEIIGETRHAVVYPGIFESEHEVVVKKIKTKTLVTLKAPVVHERVIPILGICESTDAIYFIMERAEHSLRQLLASVNDPSDFPWRARLRIAMSIAEGVHLLHSKKIIHRNLKSTNILFRQKTGSVVIADTEQAEHLDNPQLVPPPDEIGTIRRKAPETLRKNIYNEKTDVYSFGLILYELLTLREPFHDVQYATQVVVKVTRKNERPTLPGDIENPSASYIELMTRCWAENPNDRPDIKEIFAELEHMLAVEEKGTENEMNELFPSQTLTAEKEKLELELENERKKTHKEQNEMFAEMAAEKEKEHDKEKEQKDPKEEKVAFPPQDHVCPEHAPLCLCCASNRNAIAQVQESCDSTGETAPARVSQTESLESVQSDTPVERGDAYANVLSDGVKGKMSQGQVHVSLPEKVKQKLKFKNFLEISQKFFSEPEFWL